MLIDLFLLGVTCALAPGTWHGGPRRFIGACARYVMVSKFQWKPFWLATQRDPQKYWTATQNRVNYDVFAQAPLRVCVCVCVWYQTPFSSRHESGRSLFLSTGKHLVVGQLPQVSFSALPGQSSDRPNLTTPQKNFRFFSFLSPVFGEHTPRHAVDKGRIDRSTYKRSSKKLQSRHHGPLSRPVLGRRAL